MHNDRTQRVMVGFDPWLFRKIREMADEETIPLSTWIRKTLVGELRRSGKLERSTPGSDPQEEARNGKA